jgi:mRNA interferase HigB
LAAGDRQLRNILALRTLREFWRRHADAEGPLRAWHKVVTQAEWASPEDVRATYRTADIVSDNRVVFNIKHNEYRLVVKIHYNTRTVFIRFIGTHAEYDQIDATRV